jgi:hypothetical protein
MHATEAPYTYIQVHIKHGSKPKKEFATTEKDALGGMLGGHVMTQIGDSIFDFAYTKYKFHLKPDKKHSIGKFRGYSLAQFKQWFGASHITTFHIPVTKIQYFALKEIYHGYIYKSPFDYSFFGMRCAAACEYTLAKAGILAAKSSNDCVKSSFYPKLLRLHLAELAKANAWKTTVQKGSNRRIWEGVKEPSTKKKK